MSLWVARRRPIQRGCSSETDGASTLTSPASEGADSALLPCPRPNGCVLRPERLGDLDAIDPAAETMRSGTRSLAAHHDGYRAAAIESTLARVRMSEEDERREHDRISIRVGIEVKSGSVEEFVDRHIRDISTGGLFLEIDEPLARGTRIEFRLKIGDEDIIVGLGEVAWARPPDEATELPPGVGVHFIQLEGSSSRVVEAFVERQRRDDGEPEDG